MKTPRVTSPVNGGLGLMQERLRDRPWALLVGCILYAKVPGERAWPVLAAFLDQWPEPGALNHLLWESPVKVRDQIFDHIASLFAPLGLAKVRTTRVADLTERWVRDSHHVLAGRVRVESLPGCGRYAAESFRIFVDGLLMSRSVDKELRRYIRWARKQPR